jgi:predicted DNA-binding protein
MLSIQLDPAVERRLAELAKRKEQTTSDFARELIEQSLEDLEDIQMAATRLENASPP